VHTGYTARWQRRPLYRLFEEIYRTANCFTYIHEFAVTGTQSFAHSALIAHLWTRYLS